MKRWMVPSRATGSFCAVATAAVLVAVSGVEANAAERRAKFGIVGTDDRRPKDSWDAPWNAVGKIHISAPGRNSSCTGTLVRSDIVLTAAHCVHSRFSGRVFKPGTVHFVAGYRKERYIAHSKARCIKVASGFAPLGATSIERSKRDYAFIVLRKPMNIEPIGLYGGLRIDTDARLTHAGYGRDRSYLLSVHDGCRATRQIGNSVINDCDTAKGASGGPVFIRGSDRVYVAGVMSAMFRISRGDDATTYNSFTAVAPDMANLDEMGRCTPGNLRTAQSLNRWASRHP